MQLAVVAEDMELCGACQGEACIALLHCTAEQRSAEQWPALQCTTLQSIGLCYTALWVKVDGVQFSEMRSGVKIESPPGFLCHTDKMIQCIF